MLAQELRVPGALEEPPPFKEVVTDYVLAVHVKVENCAEWLRNHQYSERQEETEEPNLFLEGDHIWLKTLQKKEGENTSCRLNTLARAR